MNEALTACASADEGDVRDAIAFDLAARRYPSSAALRAKALRDTRKDSRKVVPEVLDWLAEHGDPAADPHETAKACSSAIVATLGVWILSAVIEQIVLMLVRWYFSSNSQAWRAKAQQRHRGHAQ